MYAKVEIDFDVYKEITTRRESPDVTENEVLRKVFGLPETKIQLIERTSLTPHKEWEWKGVTLPAGTELLSEYLGRRHSARIEDGWIAIDGRTYKSPSKAASTITRSQVNGWKFWKYKNPATNEWHLLNTLRVNRKVEETIEIDEHTN